MAAGLLVAVVVVEWSGTAPKPSFWAAESSLGSVRSIDNQHSPFTSTHVRAKGTTVSSDSPLDRPTAVKGPQRVQLATESALSQVRGSGPSRPPSGRGQT